LLHNSLFDYLPESNFPQTLLIRLARDEDLLNLYSNFYSRQSFPIFRDRFHRFLERQENGRSFWLIVELNLRLIGNGQLIIYPNGAELANLGVVKEHQNRRIGTGMIHILSAIARQVGVKSVEIGAAVSNARALSLYRRLGFEEDRCLKLIDSESVIILRKEL